MSAHGNASGAGTSAPRFLTDMNFNRRIITGLRRRAVGIDLVTVQERGLQEMPDPNLLAEAERLDRILLAHDFNTTHGHFARFIALLAEYEHGPGVMLTAQDFPIGPAIEALLEVWACSSHAEWRDRLTYLPL